MTASDLGGGRSRPALLPRLYVVADEDVCRAAGWTLTDYASACFDGGATLVQIRAKSMAARPLLLAASDIVVRGFAYGARVVVNDRVDLAALSSAAGVHVGQDDLTVEASRHILGAGAIVGLSTHTIGQIETALAEPISYLAIGPVFGTRTKETGYQAVGLDRVREAAMRAAAADVPVAAIGGITLDRAAAVIDAGAATVAVITDLLHTGDPRARVAAYLRELSHV